MADIQGMQRFSGQQMTPHGAVSISDVEAAELGNGLDQKQAVDDSMISTVQETQIHHTNGESPISSQPQDLIAKHISPQVDTESSTLDHNPMHNDTADSQSTRLASVIDVSRGTEDHQQGHTHAAAGTPGQTNVVVMPSATDNLGPPDTVEPTTSEQSPALASQIPAHDITDAMDIIPEVASLLPNSGIERTATPMMEAEPVVPVQQINTSVAAVGGLPQTHASTSNSQGEQQPRPSTAAIDETNAEGDDVIPLTDVPSQLPVIAVDNDQPQHQDELHQADEVLPDTGEPSLATADPLLPEQAPEALPLDEGAFSDTDSALGAIEEHGRTYHSYKHGKYVLPNDYLEQERLDAQHQMMMTCNDGRLFQAPLDFTRVNRVLDIATGTGIWCIDFADDFPNAEVIGSDLSPIQPRWCPPNCHFEVDDAEDDWVWNEPFSYIHGRALVTCFEDPLDVIKKCFQNLEPGGWLEFQDATFPFDYEEPNMPPVEPGRMDQPYTNPLQYWEQLTYEASIRGGRRWDNVRKYKQMFEEAGFVDVVEHKSKAPLGVINYKTKKELSVWKNLTQKEMQVGILHGPSIYNGLEGMSNRNFQRLGIPQAQTTDIVRKARAVMANNTVGAYNWIFTVYGRRPEQGE